MRYIRRKDSQHVFESVEIENITIYNADKGWITIHIRNKKISYFAVEHQTAKSLLISILAGDSGPEPLIDFLLEDVALENTETYASTATYKLGIWRSVTTDEFEEMKRLIRKAVGISVE
jgi:hypothetical protein